MDRATEILQQRSWTSTLPFRNPERTGLGSDKTFTVAAESAQGTSGNVPLSCPMHPCWPAIHRGLQYSTCCASHAIAANQSRTGALAQRFVRSRSTILTNSPTRPYTGWCSACLRGSPAKGSASQARRAAMSALSCSTGSYCKVPSAGGSSRRCVQAAGNADRPLAGRAGHGGWRHAVPALLMKVLH